MSALEDILVSYEHKKNRHTKACRLNFAGGNYLL